MEVTGNYRELSTLLEELKQSPEAQRILGPQFFDSARTTTEGKESAPTCESQTDPDPEQKNGLTISIWIADARRGDGKRFIVRADERLTAFLELESAIDARGELL
jgi:hypothetical protein